MEAFICSRRNTRITSRLVIEIDRVGINLMRQTFSFYFQFKSGKNNGLLHFWFWDKDTDLNLILIHGPNSFPLWILIHFLCLCLLCLIQALKNRWIILIVQYIHPSFSYHIYNKSVSVSFDCNGCVCACLAGFNKYESLSIFIFLGKVLKFFSRLYYTLLGK